MSYALETKKRKFHRVLDSISNATNKVTNRDDTTANNATTTASTSLTASMHPTIKKVRLTPNGSERDDAVQVAKSPSGQITSRQASPSLSIVSSGSAGRRPNFVPWDRERFLERLETFRRVDRWSPKPAAVNEVQWAKRGWSCVDVMRVECVGGCGRSVVVKLPDDVDELGVGEEEGEFDAEKAASRREVRTYSL